jgi:hypothetical protein
MSVPEEAPRGGWKKAYAGMYKKREKEEERAAELTAVFIDQALSVAGNGIPAYLNGLKAGMPAVARIPIDAIGYGLTQAAGWVAMFMGYPWGRHILAFSSGIGNWWLGGIFAKWGQERRRKQKNPDGTLKFPEPAAGTNQQYTLEEAEKLNLQVRQPIMKGEPAHRAHGAPAPQQRPYWMRHAA